MENQNQGIDVDAQIVIKQYQETVHKLTSENIMLKSLLIQTEMEKEQLKQGQQQKSE